MAETKTLIEQARLILESPDNWTKKASERKGKSGKVQRCLAGALYKAAANNNVDPNSYIAKEMMTEVSNIIKSKAIFTNRVYEPIKDGPKVSAVDIGTFGHVSRFNDHSFTTHAEVLSVLDSTIAKINE